MHWIGGVLSSVTKSAPGQILSGDKHCASWDRFCLGQIFRPRTDSVPEQIFFDPGQILSWTDFSVPGQILSRTDFSTQRSFRSRAKIFCSGADFKCLEIYLNI